MGAPNVLTKVADKIPAMVKASNVKTVAKKFKVSENSVYYHLSKASKKKIKKK